MVAALPHPNIVQVFDIGEDDDSYYFVMEHLDGLNLRQLMRRCRESNARVPLEHAIQIVLAVAEGLHAAHEARGPAGEPLSIVHRDISPNNIVVTSEGTVKLIDFGIAKSRSQRAQTEAGIVKGKVAYMSPEQGLAQPLDRRTDLYALGVILFELVTGARPHGSRYSPDLLHQITTKDCVDPRMRTSHCPDELAKIINKLLQRDRKERYQSARDLHQDLSVFAAQQQLVLTSYQLASWVQDTALVAPTPRAFTQEETHILAIGTGSGEGESKKLDLPKELVAEASSKSDAGASAPARWGLALALFLGCSTLVSVALATAYHLTH
jgi:serine/threonine-protein kinase